MEHQWLLGAIERYGYIAVLIAVGLESTGIPFPGETALIAAAVYAGTGGHLSIVGVIAAAAAGAILGDNLGYTIGHIGGHRLLRRFAHVLHINERHLAYAEAYFERHGDKTVFFGRFISILRTWAAFLAGVNHMPRRSFMIWNALGGVLWAIGYGTLGYLLGNNLPLLGRILHIMGVGGTAVLVAIVVSALATWLLLRRGILRAEHADAARARLASWLVRPGFTPPEPTADPPTDSSPPDLPSAESAERESLPGRETHQS